MFSVQNFPYRTGWLNWNVPNCIVFFYFLVFIPPRLSIPCLGIIVLAEKFFSYHSNEIIDVDNATAADTSVQFCVFLVNGQTGLHTKESRTIRFWCNSDEKVDASAAASQFFQDLVSPDQFPLGNFCTLLRTFFFSSGGHMIVKPHYKRPLSLRNNVFSNFSWVRDS